MKGYKKKSAVGVGAPATENRKRYTINSILKNGGDVKVLIKRPGAIPEFIKSADIPQEFLSRKLKVELLLSSTLALVCDPKSKEPINLSVDRIVYRGTVVILRGGLSRVLPMSYSDGNDAFVWLMKHRV